VESRKLLTDVHVYACAGDDVTYARDKHETRARPSCPVFSVRRYMCVRAVAGNGVDGETRRGMIRNQSR